MLRIFYKLVALIALSSVYNWCSATHLVGGSMSYEYMGAVGGGKFRYKVTLTLYRDCSSGTPFDGQILIGAYYNSNPKNKYQEFTFSLLSDVDVTPPQGAGCPSLTSVCLKQGLYSRTIDVDASSQGYHLFYERCCRNSQVNISDDDGQSYYAFIPPTSTTNSSPSFSGVPSPYICFNDTTTFLNKAIDPDGDSLTYKLVHPWAGGTNTLPNPSPPNILTLPINEVAYNNGYSATKPFGNSGIASIDTFNGLTTMYSPAIGRYSMAIEVTEWRNGKVLSTVRLDVQIIVLNCAANQVPTIYPLSGTYNQSVNAGETICFDVRAYDSDNPAQRVKISARGEVFGTEPNWQGPAATLKTDSANGTVTSKFCWNTSCAQGKTTLYNFVVDAIDNGCPPKSRSVTFTVEVKKFSGVNSFTGKQIVCENDTSVLYSTPLITGYKYKWTITGGTIIGTDTQNTVKVNWGSPGTGKLFVVQTNSVGCVGPQLEYPVTIGNYPAPIVFLPDTVCEFSTKLYAITPTSGSTYQWISKGGVITSNPQPFQANLQWGGVSNSALMVLETNNFGCVSDTNKKSVIITKATIDSIYGSQSVCPNIRGVKYSVSGAEGALYQWFITGGTIVAGDSTQEITVNWGPPGIGTIKVRETTKWGCVGDTVRISAVINHILIGFKPVGNDSMCELEKNVPYTVVNTTGSEYFWSINGGTIIKDDTTHNIIANWGTHGNTAVSVYEISYDSVNNIPCIGAPVTLDVVLHPYPTRDTIEGDFKICEGLTGVLYTLRGFAGSKYLWMIDGDSIGIGGQGNATIQTQLPNVGSYKLSVIETSRYGCRGPEIDSTIIVTPQPKTQPIVGDTIVCYPYFYTRRYTTQGLPGSDFRWQLNGGTIDSGNGTPVLWATFSGQKFNSMKVVEVSDEGCVGDTMYKDVFADRPFLTIRYISVGFPDNYMKLAWQLDSAPLYNDNFVIQRRAAGPPDRYNWANIDTVPGNKFTYNDTNINTDNNPLQYRIGGKNLCRTDFFSPLHTNIWLTAGPAIDYETRASWTNYEGWDNGVNPYVVYRRNDDATALVYSRSVGQDTTDYYTDGLDNYIQRYRVMGLENTGNGDTTWSNEVEVKLPAILWMPNAFTPNDDALNTQYSWVGGSIKSFSIEIYNRWGERLFATDNPRQFWDGYYKGQRCDDGVYLYQVTYMGGDNIIKQQKGNITLMR